jgi:hypothetical protein
MLEDVLRGELCQQAGMRRFGEGGGFRVSGAPSELSYHGCYFRIDISQGRFLPGNFLEPNKPAGSQPE